jgi:hypothetical protein
VNALGQATNYTYDFNTGQVTSISDPNHQTTSYAYESPSGWLQSIQYPDLGSKQFAYSEDQGPISSSNPAAVTITTATGEPSGSITRKTIYDGLGRTVHTQLQSDPAGTVFADTTYDGLGRVASVSNPYRATSESTYGITSYLYDAIGRMTQQTNPDNSNQKWNYNSNTVNFTDEVGHNWQRTTDALGRLTKVLEPDANNNPTLETDYQYDALANLTQVDQWGGPTPSRADDNEQYAPVPAYVTT